jgi:hypothetical protein
MTPPQLIYHEIEADVLATFAAVTEVGPSGASLPTTTVQAASSEVLPSEAETVLTLIRWMAERSRPERIKSHLNWTF